MMDGYYGIDGMQRGWEYHGNDTSKMCKLVSFMMMLNMVLTF